MDNLSIFDLHYPYPYFDDNDTISFFFQLLNHSGISNACVYSNLDPSARKINVAKFASRKVQALIVTDVAARGIDIPFLDNVINYNFPAKAKLFIHRVGKDGLQLGLDHQFHW